MSLKIAVIIGSTREGRFGDKPAAWIHSRFEGKSNVEAEIIDLRDYPLPFFNEQITPSMIKEPYSNPQVQKWTKKIAELDGFIIVTAEYNHGYPAVLKNALDYIQKEWHHKPVGFVAYGSAGGARAVEQLRQVAVELQMVPIKYAVHMMFDVLMALMKDPSQNPAVFALFNDKADIMIDQLIEMGEALKPLRK